MHKPKNLEKDVQDELDWDPLLDDKRISVSVGDGRVTLTGAVDTYFDRLRASADAAGRCGASHRSTTSCSSARSARRSQMLSSPSTA